jgi:hypothetical protein
MKSPQCERHRAAAGWECTVCHEPLCPDCTAVKTIPPVSLLACGRCGEMAEPLLRKKSESASLAERLPGAFTFPFKGEGLPAWLGISMFLWLFSFFGVLGAVIGWSITLASLFGLTRSTARGGDHIELSDFQDPLQSILMPLVRFSIVMFPAWGGAILSVWLGQPWIGWVSLVLSALWSPTAYIGAAAGANLVHMLNPLRVLGSTARIGKDFGVYLAGIFAVAVTILASFPLAFLVNQVLLVPVLGGVLVQMVLAFGPFVGARLAGLVLMLHGPVFGWGEEHDLWEPMLGDAQPRGELPVKERTLPRHLPTSIELEPEAAPELPPATARDRFAAIEMNPHAEAPPDVAPLDVALLPSFSEQSAVSIRQAMAQGKADVALDGFRSTGLSAAEKLSFDELVWLGQTATSHIDYESAELAFSKASERAAPPEALGRARVMFARLLAERLNRKDDAATWMKRVLTEQPGTPAATYAQDWLNQLPPG